MAKTNLPTVTQAMKAAGIRKIVAQLNPFSNSWLALVNLRVVQVPAVQRQISDRHVKEMLSNDVGDRSRFAAQLIVISYRDGILYVPDGNHRRQMYIDKGETYVLVELFLNITEQEEAELFFLRNGGSKTTRRIDGWVRFKSALRAGRQPEADIYRIVQESGLRLLSVDEPNGRNADIISPGILNDAYMGSGDAILLRRFLKVLKQAFRKGGEMHPMAKQLPLLRGILLFLRTYKNASDILIIRTLKRAGPEAVWNLAEQLRTSRCVHRTEKHHVCEAIRQLMTAKDAVSMKIAA